MGFSASANWEVRTGGSDSQAGIFDAGVSGFPTDGAATVATGSSPVFTSASYSFVAGDVGAWVYIKSGTNWISGWYQIASVASGAATLSAAVGAANLGSSLNTAAGCATTASPTGATWGIDYSQLDSALITFSDMVIDATTNTKFTSAANPVGKNFVGNGVNVTSGTGFTVQRVVVVSTVGTVATCDKSLGTTGSTGGAGKLGAAVVTVGTAITNLVASNTVYIKTGTYTQTGAIAYPSLSATVIGYQSVRNDWGTPPLLTTATNSTHLIDLGGANTNIFKNISFSNTAATRSYGLVATGNSTTLVLAKCTFDGFVYGVNGENATWWPFAAVNAYRCEFKNCSTYGIINQNPVTARNCNFHGNTTASITINGSSTTVDLSHNIFAGGQYGLYYSNGTPGTLKGFNNTFSSQTGSAVECPAGFVSSGLYWENNIVYGAGAWALDFAAGSVVVFNQNNAYGANVSGNLRNIATGTNQVTLTADPFTNSAGGDYSLNTAAGGGALCKGTGYPGAFPGGTSTGYLDIGAVQSQGSGGGGAGAANYGFIG